MCDGNGDVVGDAYMCFGCDCGGCDDVFVMLFVMVMMMIVVVVVMMVVVMIDVICIA